MDHRKTRGRIILDLFGERLVYERVLGGNTENTENIAENFNNIPIEGKFKKNEIRWNFDTIGSMTFWCNNFPFRCRYQW